MVPRLLYQGAASVSEWTMEGLAWPHKSHLLMLESSAFRTIECPRGVQQTARAAGDLTLKFPFMLQPIGCTPWSCSAWWTWAAEVTWETKCYLYGKTTLLDLFEPWPVSGTIITTEDKHSYEQSQRLTSCAHPSLFMLWEVQSGLRGILCSEEVCRDGDYSCDISAWLKC